MQEDLLKPSEVTLPVENNLHWVLDVGFVEDNVKGCQGHSAENLAVIRHIGINLLSKDKKRRWV